MKKIKIGENIYETPYNTIRDEIALCEPIVQAHILNTELLLENMVFNLTKILEDHDIPNSKEYWKDIHEANEYFNYDAL